MNWFNDLKIRQKLFLGFGSIVVLVVILVVTSYVTQRFIQTTLENVSTIDIAISQESADSYAEMLNASQADGDYLENFKTLGFAQARAQYVTDVQTHVAAVRTNLGDLQALLVDEPYTAPFEEMTTNLNSYETLFLQTVSEIETRGFKDSGLEGEFRAKIHEVETITTEDHLDTLTIDVLTIRRHEKDYLLRDDQQYLDNLQTAVDQFKTDVAASTLSAEDQTHLILLIDEYHDLFKQLVAMDKTIAEHTNAFHEALNRIEEPLTALSSNAFGEQRDSLTTLEQTARFFIDGIVVLGLIAIIASIGAARGTANPITNALQRAVVVANRISQGDLQQSLNIESKDELGDMARAFNGMIAYQQGMATVATQLSQGNLKVSVQPQSNQDVLGLAFTNMLQYQQTVAAAAQQVAQGNLGVSVTPVSNEDVLGNAFQQMVLHLRELTHENEAQIWSATGKATLNDVMRGQPELTTLVQNVVSQICHYLDAQIGALYLAQGDTFHLKGSYAYMQRKSLSNKFALGEGLVGQSALEKKPIVLSNVPDDYIKVNSGLGEKAPTNIVVVPLLYENKPMGVLEIGSLYPFTPRQLEFVTAVAENIAITINVAQARTQMNELLQQTQQQAEELQVQQEELRVTNEELAEQTERLKASEVRLRGQQAELEETNTRLEESATNLKEKQAAIDRQNQDLLRAQKTLERKAEELALTSKYKSEFLANMSHELRTPLNSLLILARMLASNEEGNLSAEQIESARIIYSGGQDLLSLINEILDLAKVESGKMEFHMESVAPREVVEDLRLQFTPQVEQKGIAFHWTVAENVPATIQTDQKRLTQILRNLLGNALKFTDKGSISLLVEQTTNPDTPSVPLIAFHVQDTGIGIKPEQQQVIFEAFQQADGGTSRMYGGTGLGLSISREMAFRLGGNIRVESEWGKGSTFTLALPLIAPQMAVGAETAVAPLQETIHVMTTSPTPPTIAKSHALETVADDRANLRPQDKVLLVIEDDPAFAKILFNFAHKKAFKVLIAHSGEEGLELADSYKPAGIILDLNLPTMSGWEILENLKQNPNTRHIPVHIMSVYDANPLNAFKRGAIGYLTKPVSAENLENSFNTIESFIERKIGTLLLVEDDQALRFSVKKLLDGEDIKIIETPTGAEAIKALREQHIDCMILDLNLPDMRGMELLNLLHEDKSMSRCPVIIYTGQELTREESNQLLRYADSVIIKGVKSPERLLDETSLFLHRVVADMPRDKQETLRQLYNKEAHLTGKKILVVDDDMRNSFALSKLLSERGLLVEIAANGQKALELLAAKPIDLVLMDVMMPVMDGFETMRRIREKPEFKNLPILALTAKAMQGDREACIAAGANDYLSKPIDADRLFSMLRVWLYENTL